MKIAEALVRIKDLKGKFAELEKSFYNNTTFDLLDSEMEAPDLTPAIDDIIEVSENISKLKARVALTNVTHGLHNKIHEMEHLRSVVKRLGELTREKQSQVMLRTLNYGEATVKVTTVATYDVEKLIERVQGFRDRIREIDLELQRLNWEIDLVE